VGLGSEPIAAFHVFIVEMTKPIAARGARKVEAADDQRLLERVAAGDREAFQTIYERYGARVVAMVRRQVSEPAVAEELTQEVFVAAWLGASGYRRYLGEPEGWLLGITRHKLLDHCRRLRRMTAAAVVQPGVPEARATLSPDLDRRLSRERALVGLKSDQRQVVDLVYGTGLTFSEAARTLNIPTGTVKSRMNAALTALRAVFMGTPCS